MVSAETLLQGSWYALEQAGRLMRSAVVLFKHGDPGTAVAVAMFGREELGRSRILRDVATEVRDGKKVSRGDIKKFCEDHVAKQAAAAVSTSFRVRDGTKLGAAMRTRLGSKPGSQDWQQASVTIDAATSAKRKKDPQSRHEARGRGLYVDLDPAGTTWIRPAAVTPGRARDDIFDAVGEYSRERDRFRDEVVQQDFPEMAAARAKMQPSPVLPDPIWPE